MNKQHDNSTPRKKTRAKEAVIRKRMVYFSNLCVAFACVFCAAALLLQHFTPSSEKPSGSENQNGASVSIAPIPQEPVVNTVRFSASGDNLIHDGLYLQAKADGQDGAYNFAPLYENVADFYKNYDVNWINQETLLSDDFPPSGYPMFCSPTAVATALYDIGFRVFALSNNHSYDKGAAGIASTLAFWDTMPEDTLFPGFYRDEADYTNVQTHTVNDITIAYLPYTEHTNGLPTPADASAHVIYTHQTDVIEQQIKYARTIADVVIPTVHWGTENSHTVNEAQRTLAQQMADWGADVIIGTHPHVIQPVETVTAATTGKQVPVFYCLGNFVSLQNEADNLIEIVGTFTITKTIQPDGASATAINDVQTHPLVMHYDAGWKNARVYWAEDYTEELAGRHRNGAVSPSFAQKVLNEI